MINDGTKRCVEGEDVVVKVDSLLKICSFN